MTSARTTRASPPSCSPTVERVLFPQQDHERVTAGVTSDLPAERDIERFTLNASATLVGTRASGRGPTWKNTEADSIRIAEPKHPIRIRTGQALLRIG